MVKVAPREDFGLLEPDLGPLRSCSGTISTRVVFVPNRIQSLVLNLAFFVEKEAPLGASFSPKISSNLTTKQVALIVDFSCLSGRARLLWNFNTQGEIRARYPHVRIFWNYDTRGE